MRISIETPAFKGAGLQRCIDSVLHQSAPNWTFSVLWDGGDEESRRILEELDRRKLSNVTVYFAENRGIARARRFLTEHSQGDYILPLDDDDVLPFHAVERFSTIAAQKPWAAVIRGQRKIIDEEGKVLRTPPWFPFEPRHYQYGMVTDLMNHTQPYLISRSAYDRTSGWEGFEDFGYAGEDCDIYLKLEEVGTIELIDEPLYYYRIHPNRASLVLTDQGAYEMWRRLADKTIARIGLPLKRVSEKPPFEYTRVARPQPTLDMVDFLITEGPEQRDGSLTAEALRRSGIADDAIHPLSQSAAGLSETFRRATRPFLCLLDAAIAIDDTAPLQMLLSLMHQHDADLAAPKLITENGDIFWANPGFGDQKRPEVRASGEPDEGQYDGVTSAAWLGEALALVRREVIKAVGGIDPAYDDPRTAMVDFSLRARQRDLRCTYIGSVAFTCRRADWDRSDDAALLRLRRKWVDYPQLFT